MRIHLVQVAEQYGKNGICFCILFGFRKVVIISSPQVMKQIGFHPNLKDKPPYVFESFLKYTDGPFTTPSSDDVWKMKRKEHNNLLKKSSVENNFYNIFLKSADKLVELMLDTPSTLDIEKAVLGVTQSVTMEALFGVDGRPAFDPEIIDHMYTLKNIITLIIGNPGIAKTILNGLGPFDGLLIRQAGALKKLSSQIMKQVHVKLKSSQHFPSENTKSNYSLSMYIASRTEKSKKFDQNVLTELQELFITSSSTVSSTMSCTIICLAVLPEMQEKAWKEQQEIFGDDTREPSLEDLERMIFLERFIKESLRFCGPPLIAKHAAEDIKVDGVIIPKDAIVVYMLDFMRKDPKYWKDPKLFDPDRFLEGNECLNYTYAPFGIGVRTCPGMNFAMTQMKITLSKVLRRVKLSTVKKGLKFENLEFEAMLLMELKNPPFLKVEERIM